MPDPKGWVDYAPSSVTLTVGGSTYSVATYTDSPLAGFTVAVFDTTQIFGNGHYGAGFIQTPIPDGAGIVGDWLAATPGYSATSLVPTTYSASDYFGVGLPFPVNMVQQRKQPNGPPTRSMMRRAAQRKRTGSFEVGRSCRP